MSSKANKMHLNTNRRIKKGKYKHLQVNIQRTIF